jgi:hypothetical protein
MGQGKKPRPNLVHLIGDDEPPHTLPYLIGTPEYPVPLGEHNAPKTPLQRPLGPPLRTSGRVPSSTPEPSLPGNPLSWLQGYLGEIATRLGRGFTAAQEMQDADITPGMKAEDEPFLRQFLSPNEDILPKQHRRPSSLSKDKWPQGVQWRRMSIDPKDVEFMMPQEEFARFMKEGKPQKLDGDRVSLGGDVTSGAQSGLGRHRVSLGKDKEGMYVSVYDVLDYESEMVNPVIGQLLQAAGKPYAVYDRFYIDPASLSLVNKEDRQYNTPMLRFSGKVTHR